MWGQNLPVGLLMDLHHFIAPTTGSDQGVSHYAVEDVPERTNSARGYASVFFGVKS